MGNRTDCACSCGAPITHQSSSTWFASEACQKAWNARRLGHAVPNWPPAVVPQPRHATDGDPWADVFTDRTDWPAHVTAVHTPHGVLRRT